MVCLVLGLALMVAGAELLVLGSARLAARFGISSLMTGLTVVALKQQRQLSGRHSVSTMRCGPFLSRLRLPRYRSEFVLAVFTAGEAIAHLERQAPGSPSRRNGEPVFENGRGLNYLRPLYGKLSVQGVGVQDRVNRWRYLLPNR